MKRTNLASLFCLPVLGIAVLTTFKIYQANSVETPYHYPFNSTSSGEIALTIGKEINFYQVRIQQHPEDGLDRSALAEAYLKMARLTGDFNWYLLAEQSAQQSLTALPFNNEGATLILAQIAQARHEFPEAIALAKTVLQTKPGNEEALSVLVTAYLAIGNIPAANQAVNSLVEQIPSLITLTMKALVEVAQGKDQAAFSNFQTALSLEEPGEVNSSAWTRTLFARFQAQRGNLELAEKLNQEALRIFPNYSLALIQLADLKARQRKEKQAEALYQKIFDTPNSANTFDHLAWQKIAHLKQLQGKQEEAEKLWQQAENRLRQHQTLNFGHRRELAHLLLLRGHQEDLVEALFLMKAEVKLRRDPETLDTMAWVLSRLERHQEAQQFMQELLSQGIRDAKFFYRAGFIAQKLDQPTQANQYFQLAKATDSTLTMTNDQL
jgi:tetratricopeptide (TPR) repeat protein